MDREELVRAILSSTLPQLFNRLARRLSTAQYPYGVPSTDLDRTARSSRGDLDLPLEPGYQGLEARPWLAGGQPWRSDLDFPPLEPEQTPLPQASRRRRKSKA